MKVTCPQCHAQGVVVGKVYNQIDYMNPPAHFRPDDVPFYAIFVSNVGFRNRFSACTFCGFLWTKIDAQKLQRFMAGKEGV